MLPYYVNRAGIQNINSKADCATVVWNVQCSTAACTTDGTHADNGTRVGSYVRILTCCKWNHDDAVLGLYNCILHKHFCGLFLKFEIGHCTACKQEFCSAVFFAYRGWVKKIIIWNGIFHFLGGGGQRGSFSTSFFFAPNVLKIDFDII